MCYKTKTTEQFLICIMNATKAKNLRMMNQCFSISWYNNPISEKVRKGMKNQRKINVHLYPIHNHSLKKGDNTKCQKLLEFLVSLCKGTIKYQIKKSLFVGIDFMVLFWPISCLQTEKQLEKYME